MLAKYQKVMDVIEKIVRVVLAVLLIAMFAVSVLEVFRRYVLSKTFMWSDELLRFSLAWIGFCGGSIAFRRSRLAHFDNLESKLKGKGKVVLGFVTNTIIILFAAWLTYKSYSYAFSPVMRKQVSMGAKVPMTFFYLSIPIGMIFFILFAIEKYGLLIKQLNKKGDEGE